MSIGNSKDSLGDRMKSYEELSTSRQLMPNCPVYARIDGRAFHTLCKGLKKPYSEAFIQTMQEVCKYLVFETGAILGYVQSDEISLGWTDYSKAPFEGRIQKLESVLASMAAAKFVQFIEASKSSSPLVINYGIDVLWHRTQIHVPSFDCRVFNLPNEGELANAFLWRENDAIKNSITGMALHFFSHKDIQGKSGEEKIAMMKKEGYDFYRDTPPAFLRGTFYHRENYLNALTDEEVARIPEKQRENLEYNKDGYTLCLPNNRFEKVKPNIYYCWRSHIVAMNLPYRLTDTKDLATVLFENGIPMLNKDNPTFELKWKE